MEIRVEKSVEEIKSNLRTFIANSILYSGNRYPYPDDYSFLENGVVDSMNIMEIVLFVENHFKIKVDDEDIIPDNFDSIDRLERFILYKKLGVH